MKSQFVIFLIFILVTSTYSQVKFVFEIFRNGLRSPLILNSSHKDLFGEKWLDNAELTPQGMKRQFIIGSKLRNYYLTKLNFLPPTFDNSIVEIFSVDYSTNILTLYSQLLGLYPSGKGALLDKYSIRGGIPNFDLYNSDDVFNEMGYVALPYQSSVYPIKTFPPENTFFGLTNEKICTGVGPLIKENLKKAIVNSTLQNFQDNYYDLFQIPLNLTANYFNYYKNTSNFCNTFMANHKDKREFKKIKYLVTKGNDKGNKLNMSVLYKECRKFTQMALFEIKLSDPNNKIIKASQSNIIRKIIAQFDFVLDAENKNKTHSKFLMHTGHERDIGALMAFLQISHKIPLYYPNYSSTLLMEFVKNFNAPKVNATENDYTINIYLNELTLITQSYKEFKRLLLAATIKSKKVDDFCGFTDYTDLYFIIAASLLSCAFVGFAVWIFFLLRKPKLEEVVNHDELDTRPKVGANGEPLLRNE